MTDLTNWTRDQLLEEVLRLRQGIAELQHRAAAQIEDERAKERDEFQVPNAVVVMVNSEVFRTCQGLLATPPPAPTELLARLARAESRCLMLKDELQMLQAIVDDPRVDEFFDSLRTEIHHQRHRWGDAHDAQKSLAEWSQLFQYLLGKQVQAVFKQDWNKYRHHLLSLAAALHQAYAHSPKETNHV